MGNDTTSKPNHGLQHFRYQFTIRQRSQARGLVWLVDQKTGREFVLRELTTNDDLQKRRIEDLVVEKRTNRCKYVLRLEDYHLQRDKRYCLDQFKAYLLFESPHKDLNEQMLQRRVDRSTFQDEELMSILQSGIMGLKYFKEVGHPHEAICSSNILINRQGIIMLSDPWYNCQEQRLPIGVRVHPSPERMQANNGVRTARVDWYAADLYSLAMVVLEAVNMDQLQDIYTRNNRQIDHTMLRKKIDRIRDPQLKMYVQGLLQSQKVRVDTANQFEAMVLNRTRLIEAKPVVSTPPVTYEITRMNTPVMDQNAKVSNVYIGYPAEDHATTSHKVVSDELAVGTTIPFINYTDIRSTQMTPYVTSPNLHSVSPAKSPVMKNLQNINLTPTSKQDRPHSQVKFNFASPSATISTVPSTTKVRSNSCAPLTIDSNLGGKIPLSIPPLPPTPKQGMQSTMSRINTSGVSSPNNKTVSFNNPAPQASFLPSMAAINPVPPALPPLQPTSQLPVTQVSSLSRLNSQQQTTQPKPNFTYNPPSSTLSTQSSTSGYFPSSTQIQQPTSPNWWQPEPPSFIKKVDSNIMVNAIPSHQSSSISPTPATANPISTNIPSSSPSGALPTLNTYNIFESKSTYGRSDSALGTDHPVTKNALNSLISDDKNKYGGYQIKNTTTSTFPTISLSGLRQGLSQNDADLFTKPELLRDFKKDGPSKTAATTGLTATPSSVSQAAVGFSNAVGSHSNGPTSGITGTNMTTGTSGFGYSNATNAVHGGLSSLSGLSSLGGGLSSLGGYGGINLNTTPIGHTTTNTFNNTTTMGPPTGSTFSFSTILSTSNPSGPSPTSTSLSPGLSSLAASPSNTPSSTNTMTTMSPLTTTLPLSTSSNMPTNSTNFSLSSLSNPLNLAPATSSNPIQSVYGKPADQPDLKSYRYNILQNNLKYNNVQQSINNLREVVLGSEPQFKSSQIPSTNFNPVQHFTHLFKGSDMVKTSLDEVPEPEVKKESPKKADNATPSKKKAGNRNNSTIQEVPQSQVSVQEQLEYVTEQYEVGSRYEGYKKNGMRNGKGRFYYQDGGYYDGNWKDNKMHGMGKLYYNQNKLAYDGQWYLDEFHGHGKVYNDSPSQIEGPFDYTDFDKLDDGWQYYEGSLVTDIREGFGRLKLSNGQVYEGEFKFDRIDGQGRFITMKGDIIEGIWRDNKLTKPQ